eukprot:COSAG01_NODE_3157_length_6489_cov_11.663380_2_plen_992_part_00
MPQPPRRTLQLPPVVPVSAGVQCEQPLRPPRTKVHHEEGGEWRHHGDESAEGAGLVVLVLREEIAKRDRWLREKDEQMLKLLESKDEQMREQMRAKDEQMREQMQAKDEQIKCLMVSMSPLCRASATPPHLQTPPVPYNPLPSPPVASSPATASAAAEQRRHTRRAYLRAVEAVPHQRTTASHDHGGIDSILDETTVNQGSVLAVALSDLQAGGQVAEVAVTAVLEHGLEALESIPRVPRKEKKAVRLLCEQVESVLEELDTQLATRLAEQCEEDELAELHRVLGVVCGMGVKLVGMAECVEAMEILLRVWKQCSDPVTGASRALVSPDAGARLRGLETLRGLPRALLTEPVAAEVAAATASVEIALDISRNCAERQAAAMSVTALALRNGTATTDAVGKLYFEGVAAILQPIFTSELTGQDGLELFAAWGCGTFALYQFVYMGETAALREAAEKHGMATMGKLSRLECTRSRYEELLPMLLKLSEHDDIALASGAINMLCQSLMSSGVVCAPVLVASREYPAAVLALTRRIGGKRQPALWWKERSDAVHLESMCLCLNYGCVVISLGVFPALPPNSAAWEELLAEAIHLCKINREAELSAQPRMPWHVFAYGVRLVAMATREQSRHKALLNSGVVDALLWTTANDFTMMGVSLSESSASATVALIGRNEGGLTLSQDTIWVVLDSVHDFWNTTGTHWRVKMATKAPVKKIVGKALPIVDMVIADANKPFILEHSTAIDDMVQGLLADHSSPRRAQDGAGKLQEICALALQNLALSDVGKAPLRSHPTVITSLRTVSLVEGGMTEKARQYAMGALFELDETARQKAKDVAATAKVAASTKGETVGHVMLSYNWGYQDVIKRINSALKARGYTVWIDIEKMQGSTVEAMADAVDDAVVVCYGISQAYKQSANCRLEAQYAFQQKKDMVPLMLQEGYSPNGWLGMILGMHLWYGFYGPTLASEGAFKGKVDELCRELGDRGLMTAPKTTTLAT